MIRTLTFPLSFYPVCFYMFSWLIIIIHLKEFNIVSFMLRRDKQSHLTVTQFFLLLRYFYNRHTGVAANLLWVKLATTMKNLRNSSMVSFQDINHCHNVLECDQLYLFWAFFFVVTWLLSLVIGDIMLFLKSMSGKWPRR